MKKETVLVYGPGYQPEECRLVKLSRYAVRLRHRDGSEVIYSLKNGRPHKRYQTAFRGYYVHHGECRRLAKLSMHQKPSTKRSSRAAEITQLLLDGCPIAGYWSSFPEVSVALDEASDAPSAFSRRRRVDIAYLERQRHQAHRQFRVFGIEVKSCKADFKADSKWELYAQRFHGLAFACPPDAISKADLPKGIGLFHYDGLRFKMIQPVHFKDFLDLEILVDTYRGLALAAARLLEQGELNP